MIGVGQPLRRNSTGGRRTNGAGLRRHGAATVVAVAALTALLAAIAGCETVREPGHGSGPAAARARADVRAGLDLYESAEYTLAARRFRHRCHKAASWES